eukprot:493627-Lingulodinium_polyedra.AAC.1
MYDVWRTGARRTTHGARRTAYDVRCMAHNVRRAQDVRNTWHHARYKLHGTLGTMHDVWRTIRA